MKIVNLNKHQVDARINGQDIAFPPSGAVATVDVKTIPAGDIWCHCINDSDVVSEEYGEGIILPGSRSEYGEIQGLPEPQNGTLYLVNMLVGLRGAALGRTDLIGPDSGPSAIRYQDGPRKGQIEAVTQFVKF